MCLQEADSLILFNNNRALCRTMGICNDNTRSCRYTEYWRSRNFVFCRRPFQIRRLTTI